MPFVFFLGYFSQELVITGTHGQLALRNCNLFGRKLNTVDNQGITGEEEIFYLDTNNKNQTNIQQQQEGEPNSGIPPVYLQGYAMLFDQLNSDLESQQQSHCDKKNSSCKNDIGVRVRLPIQDMTIYHSTLYVQYTFTV